MNKMSYACWSLVVLLLYYTVDRWTPLGPWNGEYLWPVHNDQLWLDVAVCVILLLSVFFFRGGFRPGMIVATAALGLWGYLHVQSWWLPYIDGVTSPRAIAFHAQFLGHTQILPRYGLHFPPDAEHTLIDVFVLAAFLLCLGATARSLIVNARRP
jgi:hypothetical protein